MIFRAWVTRSGPKSTDVRTTWQRAKAGMTSSFFRQGWRKYNLAPLSRSGRPCPLKDGNPARPNHTNFMVCDYNIELTIKELKGGRHVGRMQVSQEADRVERSVMLPVCAYLLLVRLYGAEEQIGKNWSLFQLKQQCAEAFMQDQVHRVEQKWLRKWRQIRKAA
jgi:hypothetical protein